MMSNRNTSCDIVDNSSTLQIRKPIMDIAVEHSLLFELAAWLWSAFLMQWRKSCVVLGVIIDFEFNVMAMSNCGILRVLF
jgi:hypothetical protein